MTIQYKFNYRNFIKFFYFLIIFINVLMASEKFEEDYLFRGVKKQKEASSINISTFSHAVDDGLELSNVLSKYDLSHAAVFFDFDETVATSQAHYKDSDYKLISCVDLNRTYEKIWNNVLNQLGRLPQDGNYAMNELKNFRDFVLLDDNLPECIKSLSKISAYVKICSGMKYTNNKKTIIDQIGLTPKDYIYASGSKKENCITSFLKNKTNDNCKINTIILIDNSFTHVLEPYMKKMPQFVKNISCCQGFESVKIVSIEFTRFKSILSYESLIKELEIFFENCDTDTELSSSSSSIN